MDDASFTIRDMTPEDLALAVEWAAAEGWNPGLDDAACFHAADPHGFLLGTLAGEPAGSISVVGYGERFAFMGLYIVRPELRGRGFGLQLWRAALDRAAGRIVGLDGVVAQQENYRRSGFQLAHRNIRYGGTGSATGDGAPAPQAAAGGGIVPLAEVPFDLLAAYDRALFPAPREAFLRSWIGHPAHRALGHLGAGGRLTGYGVLRACRRGWKIGPLFADDPGTAERLFRALTAGTGDGPVFLDVPEVNPAALRLAESHGLAPVFETARMYTAPPPEVDLARVYGITTFELG